MAAPPNHFFIVVEKLVQYVYVIYSHLHDISWKDYFLLIIIIWWLWYYNYFWTICGYYQELGIGKVTMQWILFLQSLIGNFWSRWYFISTFVPLTPVEDYWCLLISFWVLDSFGGICDLSMFALSGLVQISCLLHRSPCLLVPFCCFGWFRWLVVNGMKICSNFILWCSTNFKFCFICYQHFSFLITSDLYVLFGFVKLFDKFRVYFMYYVLVIFMWHFFIWIHIIFEFSELIFLSSICISKWSVLCFCYFVFILYAAWILWYGIEPRFNYLVYAHFFC